MKSHSAYVFISCYVSFVHLLQDTLIEV